MISAIRNNCSGIPKNWELLIPDSQQELWDITEVNFLVFLSKTLAKTVSLFILLSSYAF